MAVRSKTLGRVGSVLTLLCLIALLMSFASDRWVESSGKDNVGFENLGLWSVCFQEYYPPVNALVNRKYDGCWWVLNKELDDLRDFLIPSWFRTTQVLVTLSLVLVLIVCILLVINLINCFPHSPYRYLIKRILAIAACLMLLLTAILLFIAILIFGIKSSNTGSSWLQNNDENYLSWSFGMGILADFLAILAGMVILLQFIRHRAEKDDSNSEPTVVVTNEKPPGTNYQYNRNNSNRGGRPLADSSNRDPAYVQRYNQSRDESKTSLITPAREMFAVSGRGEVYVNNLATYDDNDRGENNYRQRGPPPRRDEPRSNGYPVPAPSQRNNSQPMAGPNRGRQLGRQGHPLRLQEPSFLKPQAQRDDGGSQNGSVYDDGDWKSSRHTSLPEYVPKPKNKNEVTATEEDSYVENDSDNASTANKRKKRQKSNDGDDGEKREGRRKTRSSSKSGDKDSRERSRSRSNSRSRKKTRNESDTDGGTPSQKRRSKKKKHRSSSVKGDSSDDDQPIRRRSRSRKNSRSRSRSKDRFTSDSQLDSDTGSTHSRSRRRKKKEKELSRLDAKRRSASEDNLSVRSGSKRRSGRSKKRYDGNVSDDFSGSEYSQRKSRRKGGRQSDGETKSRHRDYSDNESVKSRSKRSGDKPKGTYSSYYEY